MGAGQSIAKSLPSSQKYKNQTVPTQVLVNDIFLWMMRQVDTNDLLKLGNPKYCKDYVFLTKEALNIFMRHIQLEPKMGPKNVLYFSSVKDLTFQDEKAAEQKPTQKLYRDALCTQLAFFYIRVFQVFGALALTVIDSLPEVGSRVGDIRQAVFAPQVAQAPPLFAAAVGGAPLTAGDKANLQDFYTYARSYFARVDDYDDLYVITEATKGRRQYRPSDKDVIFFKQTATKNILYRTSSYEVEANLSIVNDYPGVSYTLRIENINVNDEDIGISYNVPFTYKVNDYLYGRRNFYYVLNAILNSVARPSGRERSLEDIVGEKKDEKAVVKTDEAGVPEGLSYLKIRDYLKEKPKAYCVARAIQLLSPTLTDGIKQARFESDVCFFDGKEPYMKDSVPIFNHPITDNSPGLRALNQLFYDVIRGVSPTMSVEADARYKEFLTVMQQIFSPKDDKKKLEKLSDVRSVPFNQCVKSGTVDPQDKKIVITTKNTVREVQHVIAELLNFQIQHTANVAKFLNKLFLIDKSKHVLGIHPSILKGGLPIVNKLSEEARIMLTEYYKFCEGNYRLGALKVLASENKIYVDRKK